MLWGLNRAERLPCFHHLAEGRGKWYSIVERGCLCNIIFSKGKSWRRPMDFSFKHLKMSSSYFCSYNSQYMTAHSRKYFGVWLLLWYLKLLYLIECDKISFWHKNVCFWKSRPSRRPKQTDSMTRVSEVALESKISMQSTISWEPLRLKNVWSNKNYRRR